MDAPVASYIEHAHVRAQLSLVVECQRLEIVSEAPSQSMTATIIEFIRRQFHDGIVEAYSSPQHIWSWYFFPVKCSHSGEKS